MVSSLIALQLSAILPIWVHANRCNNDMASGKECATSYIRIASGAVQTVPKADCKDLCDKVFWCGAYTHYGYADQCHFHITCGTSPNWAVTDASHDTVTSHTCSSYTGKLPDIEKKCFKELTSKKGQICDGPLLFDGRAASLGNCKLMCSAVAGCGSLNYLEKEQVCLLMSEPCEKFVSGTFKLPLRDTEYSTSSNIPVDAPQCAVATGLKECEVKTKTCGGAAATTCSTTVKSERTDTSSWDVCSGTSTSGTHRMGTEFAGSEITVEVSTEVCHGEGKESMDGVEITEEISTDPNQIVAICQHGIWTEFADGSRYVRKLNSYTTHTGKECKLPACPRPRRGSGDDDSSDEAAMKSTNFVALVCMGLLSMCWL